jgi:hypothetical protein
MKTNHSQWFEGTNGKERRLRLLWHKSKSAVADSTAGQCSPTKKISLRAVIVSRSIIAGKKLSRYVLTLGSKFRTY